MVDHISVKTSAAPPERRDVWHRCDDFASRRSSPNLGRRRNPKGGFPRSCGQDLLFYIPYSRKNVTAWVWLMLSALADRFSGSTPLVNTFHCILRFLVQTHKLSSHLDILLGKLGVHRFLQNITESCLCQVQMVTF